MKIVSGAGGDKNLYLSLCLVDIYIKVTELSRFVIFKQEVAI